MPLSARVRLSSALAVMLLGGYSATAQVRIVGMISGTVTDPTGAGVPNAAVTLKDEGTGISRSAVSNSEGGFSFPDLSFGKYEIDVTAAGFQAVVMPHIEVVSSQTTDVPVKLRVGAQTEAVTVEATATPVLETTSNLMAVGEEAKEINELPILSRTALYAARFVPGVSPPENLGNNDNHFNNLPGGSTNVTFDGINNASNGFKSGGTSFYATAQPRLGAVEEVVVETGGLGADSAGMSGTNIKLITRRGSNKYHWSVFMQPRSELFNANTWIRNAQGQGFRPKNRQFDFGGNFGGRLLPKTRFRDKVFFFVNWEDAWNPSTTNHTQTVLNPSTQQGIWTYPISGTSSFGSANLLQIGAANNYPTAFNAVIADILKKENSAIQYGYLTPIPNNYNEQTLNWVAKNNTNSYYPTTRLDYYATQALQLTFTWNLTHTWNPGQSIWPGPDAFLQNPFRTAGYFVWSAAANYAISPKTFNEFRYGVQHSGDSNEKAAPGYAEYGSYNGTPLNLSLPVIAPWVNYTPNTTGRHFITTIYDTATMIRGNHNITAGGQFRSTDWHDTAEFPQFPNYTVGYTGSDPFPSIFNATTLPGDLNTDFGPAAQMYSLIIGRLFSESQTAQLNPRTLQYNGDVKTTWTRSYQGGLYVQDRWRARPNVSINFGFRWDMQGDQYNVDGITAFPDYHNLYGPSVALFSPGVMSGNNDPVNFTHGHAFRPDWINPAPNIGFAWNPQADHGPLAKILGGKKTVIRASYSIVYYDEGTQMFAQDAGNNPGQQFTSAAVIPTSTPYNSYILDANPLPSFPVYNPVIHQAALTYQSTFTGMNPNLREPYTINWNFGIQRQLAKDLTVEVRYVGNQAHRGWRTYSLNEVNIFENGFLQEFKNAQNNLRVNTANGVANSFANLGYAGDTPLPILQAAFGPIGSTAAVAASSGFSSTGFITNLQNGAAGAMANTLATNSTYMCHMFGNTFSPCASRGYNAPGSYPINFFLLNPFSAGSLNYVDDKAWSDYNAAQVVVQKRFSHGLTWQGYYVFAKGLSNTGVSTANQQSNWTTLRNEQLDRRPSLFDIRHTFQAIGTYDLPIGRNRAVNIQNKVLDAMFGGWTTGTIMVIRTGGPVKFTSGTAFSTVNTNDPGVILAPGVTASDIQSMMVTTQSKASNATTNRQTFNTSLVGPDGRASTQYFLTPTAPGLWGYNVYAYNKNVFSWDASLLKNFRIKEHGQFQLWAGATNILNHPNWSLGGTNIQSTTFGITGSPSNSPRSMQFRGTLSF